MAAGDHAVPDPIEAHEWLEESLPVQPGGTLFVRTSRGTVDVRSHDGDEVRVEAEARGRRADQVRFVLDQSGNDVRFEVRVEGWLTGLFGSLDVRARLWVPRRYSLVLRASGGDVRIDGITGDVSLKTSGGDASLTRTVGPIDLSSSGGNLEIVHVDGDVRVKTSGGNLTLRDVFGDVARPELGRRARDRRRRRRGRSELLGRLDLGGVPRRSRGRDQGLGRLDRRARARGRALRARREVERRRHRRRLRARPGLRAHVRTCSPARSDAADRSSSCAATAGASGSGGSSLSWLTSLACGSLRATLRVACGAPPRAAADGALTFSVAC